MSRIGLRCDVPILKLADRMQAYSAVHRRCCCQCKLHAAATERETGHRGTGMFAKNSAALPPGPLESLPVKVFAAVQSRAYQSLLMKKREASGAPADPIP